ncbi:MAG: hypothetical protein GX362_06250 [Methanosarcinaceae archaeon]|nr:hypothetical protein [Methanosarcinaceae archaeon]
MFVIEKLNEMLNHFIFKEEIDKNSKLTGISLSKAGDMAGSSSGFSLKKKNGKNILEVYNSPNWKSPVTKKYYIAPDNCFLELKNILVKNKLWTAKEIKPEKVFIADMASVTWDIYVDESKYYTLFSGQVMPQKYIESFSKVMEYITDIQKDENLIEIEDIEIKDIEELDD